MTPYMWSGPGYDEMMTGVTPSIISHQEQSWSSSSAICYHATRYHFLPGSIQRQINIINRQFSFLIERWISGRNSVLQWSPCFIFWSEQSACTALEEEIVYDSSDTCMLKVFDYIYRGMCEGLSSWGSTESKFDFLTNDAYDIYVNLALLGI